jgi:hypothetical protein
MEKRECKKCGKVIEGYNRPHVNFLMRQHELKHEKEDEDRERERE